MSKPTPIGGCSAAVEFSLLQPVLADATTGSRRGLAGQECWLITFILIGGQGGAPLGLPPPLGERGGRHRNSKNLKHQTWFYPAAT
jgi:hypothetical protein